MVPLSKQPTVTIGARIHRRLLIEAYVQGRTRVTADVREVMTDIAEAALDEYLTKLEAQRKE